MVWIGNNVFYHKGREIRDKVAHIFLKDGEQSNITVFADIDAPEGIEAKILTDVGTFGNVWRSIPMKPVERVNHLIRHKAIIPVTQNEVFDMLLNITDGTTSIFQNEIHCPDTDGDRRVVVSPEPTKNHTIYSVCPRTFAATEKDGKFVSGTFKSVTEDLEYIKSLGTTVLYMLPFQLPSTFRDLTRPGNLGSIYCIRDHFSINPELGTKKDLQELVETAHNLDMLVITDMVCNHTGFDHLWTKEHPEWYFVVDGKVQPASEGERVWEDCAQLNFKEQIPELWEAIASITPYWMNEVGIDGVRLDASQKLPLDLLKIINNRAKLVKQNSFIMGETLCPLPLIKTIPLDATYVSFYWLTNEAANAHKFTKYVQDVAECVPDQLPMMVFTENHDVPSKKWAHIGTWAPETMISKWESKHLGGDFSLAKKKMLQCELINRTISGPTLNFLPMMYQGTEYGEPWRGHFMDPKIADGTVNALHREYRVDEHHRDLVQSFQRLDSMLKEYSFLRSGEVHYLTDGIFDNNVLAYLKSSAEGSALVVCNLFRRPQKVQISLDQSSRNYIFSELLSGNLHGIYPTDAGVELNLDSVDSRILLLETI